MANRAEELIAQLEAEIVKRDARISELETELEETLADWGTLRLELAALKSKQHHGGVVLPDRANPTNIRAILGEVGVHSQANQSFAELVYNHALDTVARLNPCRAQAVPDGWAMVPVEPTDEMADAAEQAETRHANEDQKRGGGDPQLGYKAIFKAMLAAAPSAQQKESE